MKMTTAIAMTSTDVDALREQLRLVEEHDGQLRVENAALQRTLMRRSSRRYRIVVSLAIVCVPPMASFIIAKASTEIRAEEEMYQRSLESSQRWNRENRRASDCETRTRNLQDDLAVCKGDLKHAACNCVAGDPLCDCL